MGVGFFKNDGHRDGALWLKEMQAAFAHVVSCWVFEKTVKMFSKHTATFHTCLTVGTIQLFISFC